MRFAVLALVALIGFGPDRLAAQQEQTLADIRQELNVLNIEIQRLRLELSTTSAPGVPPASGSVLDRVVAAEAVLKRLTERTEQMGSRIERIVTDGTNRIGDLEFRLVELEGGDISQLGETSTLGGDVATTTPPPVTGPEAQPLQDELAVGEKLDFQTASDLLEQGDFSKAIEMFTGFEQSYPGSPLAPQVKLGRGKALEGLGDTREAARSYLASFTANQTGPVAAEALFELGAALGRLGQVDQACVTLGEVGVRFPAAEAVTVARQEMATLGCG